MFTCKSSNVGMWSMIVSLIFHGLLEDFVTSPVLMNDVLFLNNALHCVYECFCTKWCFGFIEDVFRI